MHRILRLILFVPWILIALVPVALAQTSNATIGGTVLDQSGATVPGASVTLTNTVSGTSTTVVTKEDGAFQFPNLVPAKYDLQATAKTFRDFIQRDSKFTSTNPSARPLPYRSATRRNGLRLLRTPRR